MIVYIVTSGEYSDYGINAVFDNKTQAELYCAAHDDGFNIPEIEEWDTEAVKIETDKPIMHRWEAYIREDGTIQSISCRSTLKDVNSIEYKPYRPYGCYFVQATIGRDIPVEKARKIVLDRFAKWKYEQLIEQAEKWKK